MEDFKGKVAVITGAASGIGKALARRCVAEGMNVAIADLYVEGLSALADELEKQGAQVISASVDVADMAAMQAFTAAQRFAELPEVLYNMAVTAERMGDRRDAADYFREYLRLRPTAPDRGEVERRIRTLRGR